MQCRLQKEVNVFCTNIHPFQRPTSLNGPKCSSENNERRPQPIASCKVVSRRSRLVSTVFTKVRLWVVMSLYVLFTTSCTDKNDIEPDYKKRIVSIIINKEEKGKPATAECVTEMILTVARQTAVTGGGLLIIVPVVSGATPAAPYLLSVRRMDSIIPYRGKNGIDTYSKVSISRYCDSLRPTVKNFIAKCTIGSTSTADFTRALLICRNFTDVYAQIYGVTRKTVVGTDDYSNYMSTIDDKSILPIFSGSYDFWQYETVTTKGKYKVTFRKKGAATNIPIETIIY